MQNWDRSRQERGKREKGGGECFIFQFGMVGRVFSSVIKEMSGNFSDALESRVFVLCTSLLAIWCAQLHQAEIRFFFKERTHRDISLFVPVCAKTLGCRDRRSSGLSPMWRWVCLRGTVGSDNSCFGGNRARRCDAALENGWPEGSCSPSTCSCVQLLFNAVLHLGTRRDSNFSCKPTLGPQPTVTVWGSLVMLSGSYVSAWKYLSLKALCSKYII